MGGLPFFFVTIFWFHYETWWDDPTTKRLFFLVGHNHQMNANENGEPSLSTIGQKDIPGRCFLFSTKLWTGGETTFGNFIFRWKRPSNRSMFMFPLKRHQHGWIPCLPLKVHSLCNWSGKERVSFFFLRGNQKRWITCNMTWILTGVIERLESRNTVIEICRHSLY